MEDFQNRRELRKIQDADGGDYEHNKLLGYDAATLKMKAARSSQTVKFYKTTRCHI
jgi:NADH:ubiquinone oxidoreductase subunit E